MLESRQTYHSHHISQLRCFSYSQSIEHQWQSRSYTPCEDQDFARVMPVTQDISRFGGGSTAQSKTLNTFERHIEVRKVGAEEWPVQNVERSEDFTFCELPGSPDSHVYAHQPTIVTRTTSIMEPSLIEPTSVTKCPKQVHQSQHKLYGPTQECQSIWQDHWWDSTQNSWDQAICNISWWYSS